MALAKLRFDRPLLTYYRGPRPSPGRSRIMSRIRARDTGPEVAMRRAVWAMGGRYRCHPKNVPGRPDLCNQRARVAVFIDGCFWHGCPRHFRLPRTRVPFWSEKIRRNRMKRAAVLAEFGAGWTVLEFFECEVRSDTQGCAGVVVRRLRATRTVAK